MAEQTLDERLEQMRRARQKLGDGHLRTELLERATYLHAMEPEGLSGISHQSMMTMYRAADALASSPTAADLDQSEQARRIYTAMHALAKPDELPNKVGE